MSLRGKTFPPEVVEVGVLQMSHTAMKTSRHRLVAEQID
jgi:hypothetical protein